MKKFYLSKRKKLHQQQIVILCKAVIIGCFLAMVFYNSLMGIFFLLPCLPVYIKREKKRLYQKRQQQLKEEFLEVLKLIIHGLEAGYSLEHCFEQAYVDYQKMVEDKKSMMLPELKEFQKKLQVNVSVNAIVKEFAVKSELQEAENFAQIIEIARKSGGNLPAVLKRTVCTMLEKERVQEEIETMLSGKRMEQKVMTAMPVGILLYMRFTSGDYMAPLYGNPVGIIIATIGLFVTLIAIVWSDKIINIPI